MRRRDVLRAGAGTLGAGVIGGRVAGGVDVRVASSVDAPYEPLGHLELDGAKEAVVSDDGATAYVAVSDGFASVDVGDPSNPRVLAERRGLLADRESGPLGDIFDVKLEGETLLVVGPAHRSRGETTMGMLVVDVSDPSNPEEVAFHPTDFAIHNCFLRDGYAYLTNNGGEGNPVVVVEVSDGPTEVARWSPFDHDPGWNRVHPALRICHDLWVQGGVAYAAYWDAGTFLVDVSDPASPSFLARVGGRPLDELANLPRSAIGRASVTPPGNAHFVALDETGTRMGVGAEAWAVETDDGDLVGGPGGIDLYDVSKPTAIQHLSTVPAPRTSNPTRDGVWTTSHNFELRDDVLYSSWYQGGVMRHDVSDPRNPKRTAWWRDPERARFWTARLCVPGESFIASDMGIDESPAAVWTFPDRAGTQPEPPSLDSPAGTSSGTGGETASATDVRTGTGPSNTKTASGSTADASAPTDRTTTTGAMETDGSNPVIPGFGVGVGALGVGLGAWWLRRVGRDD